MAFLCVTPFSVHGQEEPLPAVVPKTPPPAAAPATLAEAAAGDDYAGFAALYDAMKTRGESVDAWTPLYDLWTWSQSDPNGAFYGREMYDRLAQAGPAFADAISALAIVDDAGNTSWPTAETRAFLLERALASEPAETPLPNVKPRSEAHKPKIAVVAPAPAARAAPPMKPPEAAPIASAPATETAAAAKPATNSGVLLLVLAMLAAGAFAIFTRAGAARENESPESDEPVPHSPSSPDHSRHGEDARGRRQ